MIKKLLLVVVALSLLIPVTACAAEGETIKIGIVLELTGDLGFMGVNMINGASATMILLIEMPASAGRFPSSGGPRRPSMR